MCILIVKESKVVLWWLSLVEDRLCIWLLLMHLGNVVWWENHRLLVPCWLRLVGLMTIVEAIRLLLILG